MRILLDENIALSVQKALQGLGHQVDHIKTLGLGGIANGEVYEKALQGYHLFVTNDRHFLNSDIFPPRPALGIVFLRISMADPTKQSDALKTFLTIEPEVRFIGHLTIMRSDGFEIQ